MLNSDGKVASLYQAAIEEKAVEADRHQLAVVTALDALRYALMNKPKNARLLQFLKTGKNASAGFIHLGWRRCRQNLFDGSLFR